ncbi:hypothetical protein CC80DRAFT_504376 [Byssothecium circinans]|uniref:U3 small nucleolar RNA-associated protein 6 N-terminal domain-containing protein n=1 Tax=Byssothecium circinans TaxID=147558 RepID=A0A6A5TVT0_9PLEO|nr:hypothetical protein CC80DRAFT_504376 [Byssothecium circinans]
MAGPSDKARFYLEHSAAELNELERKQIFTREEISSIAKKRSDFEHILNARGSKPSDYMRYVEFEQNVDALRRKRIKRMGVRYKGSGQRSIYAIFNRGTRKFSGDLALWMQYIDFARRDKAYKRLNEIFTSVVRLHPTKPELWIYAANYFMDTQADITDARSYMQRGLRFCKNSELLWLEYAKLETIYIGKIAGRAKILGLDVDRTKKDRVEDENMIALPAITAEDVNPSLGKEDGVDESALQNLASAPVLTGAIPMAIFDSAMLQFKHNPALAEDFFKMFAEFDQLPCIKRILEHVLAHLEQHASQAVETIACRFRLRLFGLHPASAEFPSAFAEALQLLGSAIGLHKAHISEVAVRQILSLLLIDEAGEIEPSVRKVLSSRLRFYSRALGEAGAGDGDAIVKLVQSLRDEGKKRDAEFLLRTILEQKFGNLFASNIAGSVPIRLTHVLAPASTPMNPSCAQVTANDGCPTHQPVPPVAVVGIVVLLAAVVGLDNHGTRPLSDVARGPNVAVQSSGDML